MKKKKKFEEAISRFKSMLALHLCMCYTQKCPATEHHSPYHSRTHDERLKGFEYAEPIMVKKQDQRNNQSTKEET